MTARLQRIHAILRSGNVPSALVSRPRIGSVLLAGTPEDGPGDVLLRDSGGRLWLVRGHGTDELRNGSADKWVAGAFVFIFALDNHPHRPRGDLDLASYGIVKVFEDRHGHPYPELPWEPKAAFAALCAHYQDH